MRQVAHSGLRLKEAAKLGFERAFVPSGIKGADGIATTHFGNVRALVDQILGR